MEDQRIYPSSAPTSDQFHPKARAPAICFDNRQVDQGDRAYRLRGGSRRDPRLDRVTFLATRSASSYQHLAFSIRGEQFAGEEKILPRELSDLIEVSSGVALEVFVGDLFGGEVEIEHARYLGAGRALRSPLGEVRDPGHRDGPGRGGL